MATKKKIQAKKKPKKVAKKVTKKPSAKVVTPFLATPQGMNQLKHHCEGIMNLVGDLILTNNPKISQKDFTTEAHGLIRVFFGMDQKKLRR